MSRFGTEVEKFPTDAPENFPVVLEKRNKEVSPTLVIDESPVVYRETYAAGSNLKILRSGSKKLEGWVLSKRDQENLDKFSRGADKPWVQQVLNASFPVRFVAGLGIIALGVITTIIPALPGSILYLGPIGIAVMFGKKVWVEKVVKVVHRILTAVIKFCDRFTMETVQRFIETGRFKRKAPKA